MAELTRFQASRKAFQSHVMRLYNKINYTMENDVDEYSIVSLITSIQQLQAKKETLAQLDKQIEKLIRSEEDIEEVVSESLELQDDIMDKITMARRFIELQSIPKMPEIAVTTTVTQSVVINHDLSPQVESSSTMESSTLTVATTPAVNSIDSLPPSIAVIATPIVNSIVCLQLLIIYRQVMII